MSNIENGFRYGTKPDSLRDGEWIYVIGKNPKYEEIRKSDDKRNMLEDRLFIVEKKLEKALALVRFLRIQITGGHIRRDILSMVNGAMSERDDPEVVLSSLRESVENFK